MERRVVAAVLLVLLCTACDGGDDAESSTTSSSPATIDTISGTTTPPPAGLEQLGVALAGDVGVPDTWAIRDLDPALLDPVMEVEADPFQGLVACPPGALRSSDQWLQRTFSAPEEPLESGLLSVDVIVELDDDAAAQAGREAIAGCAAVGPDTAVEVAQLELTPTDDAGAQVGQPVAAAEVVVTSGPSADVPYPSATALVTAHRNGRTVTAVLGGVDLGAPSAESARDLVGRLLGRFN